MNLNQNEKVLCLAEIESFVQRNILKFNEGTQLAEASQTLSQLNKEIELHLTSKDRAVPHTVAGITEACLICNEIDVAVDNIQSLIGYASSHIKYELLPLMLTSFSKTNFTLYTEFFCIVQKLTGMESLVSMSVLPKK